MKLKDPSLFRQQCYVDGKWTNADDGAVMQVTNPATGEVLGTAPCMGADETRRAIQAADTALPAWRDLTASQRAQILHRWNDLILANQDDLSSH